MQSLSRFANGGDWCLPAGDSRDVVEVSARRPEAAPQIGPGGVPAFGGANPPPMPFGLAPGPSTWPFPPVQTSPVSDIYGDNLLLSNREWRMVGNPAYGEGDLTRYSAAGILDRGGKGGPIKLEAPIHYSNLPKDLRYPCPTPAYNPMNPRASVLIAKRTGELMKGIQDCAFMRQSKKYPISPLKVQPREGREFQEMHSLLFASMVDDTNNLVGSFEVPLGFDGVLNRVTFAFTGTGLLDGSGDLLFRVKINSVYARNLGAVAFQYGSLTNSPFIIPGYGIKLVSGQLVQFIASSPAGNPLGGTGARVNMGGFGWYFPKK